MRKIGSLCKINSLFEIEKFCSNVKAYFLSLLVSCMHQDFEFKFKIQKWVHLVVQFKVSMSKDEAIPIHLWRLTFCNSHYLIHYQIELKFYSWLLCLLWDEKVASFHLNQCYQDRCMHMFIYTLNKVGAALAEAGRHWISSTFQPHPYRLNKTQFIFFPFSVFILIWNKVNTPLIVFLRCLLFNLWCFQIWIGYWSNERISLV